MDIWTWPSVSQQPPGHLFPTWSTPNIYYIYYIVYNNNNNKKYQIYLFFFLPFKVREPTTPYSQVASNLSYRHVTTCCKADHFINLYNSYISHVDWYINFVRFKHFSGKKKEEGFLISVLFLMHHNSKLVGFVFHIKQIRVVQLLVISFQEKLSRLLVKLQTLYCYIYYFLKLEI